MRYAHTVVLSLWFALSCGVFVVGCGASQRPAAEDDQTASSPNARIAGEELKTCEAAKSKGIVASREESADGIVLHVASDQDDVVGQLQDEAASRVETQQQQEDAFAQIHATKHEEGDALFVRFEHEDEEVLKAVQEILQAGIDRRRMAKGRVHLVLEDGHLDMQLPSGGIAGAKASKGADETVEKWTDRTPTTFELKNTEDGFDLTIRTDESERVSDLKRQVDQALSDCP